MEFTDAREGGERGGDVVHSLSNKKRSHTYIYIYKYIYIYICKYVYIYAYMHVYSPWRQSQGVQMSSNQRSISPCLKLALGRGLPLPLLPRALGSAGWNVARRSKFQSKCQHFVGFTTIISRSFFLYLFYNSICAPSIS